jgi:hypothetical protein
VAYQNSSREDPVGCTLAGCLGGGLLGLFGGGLFLILLAVILAVFGSDPTLEATPPDQPDLRANISESFLNRFVEQPAEGSIRVNVLPDNQVELIVDTLIQGLGVNVPAQIIGRFEIQLAEQTLAVRLVDTQVQGLQLPPELIDIFSNDIPLINQNLQTMVNEMSQRLGISIRFTGLRTDENGIHIEAREAR